MSYLLNECDSPLNIDHDSRDILGCLVTFCGAMGMRFIGTRFGVKRTLSYKDLTSPTHDKMLTHNTYDQVHVTN